MCGRGPTRECESSHHMPTSATSLIILPRSRMDDANKSTKVRINRKLKQIFRRKVSPSLIILPHRSKMDDANKSTKACINRQLKQIFRRKVSRFSFNVSKQVDSGTTEWSTDSGTTERSTMLRKKRSVVRSRGSIRKAARRDSLSDMREMVKNGKGVFRPGVMNDFVTIANKSAPVEHFRRISARLSQRFSLCDSVEDEGDGDASTSQKIQAS